MLWLTQRTYFDNKILDNKTVAHLAKNIADSVNCVNKPGYPDTAAHLAWGPCLGQIPSGAQGRGAWWGGGQSPPEKFW